MSYLKCGVGTSLQGPGLRPPIYHTIHHTNWQYQQKGFVLSPRDSSMRKLELLLYALDLFFKEAFSAINHLHQNTSIKVIFSFRAQQFYIVLYIVQKY